MSDPSPSEISSGNLQISRSVIAFSTARMRSLALRKGSPLHSRTVSLLPSRIAHGANPARWWLREHYIAIGGCGVATP